MSKICKLIEAENPIMKVRLSGCSPDLDRDVVEEKLLDSMKIIMVLGYLQIRLVSWSEYL